MTKRGRYCLLFLAVFLAAIIVFLVTLRLTNFGVIVLAFKTNDPSGISILYQKKWKVCNLWFSPLGLDIVGKTCACISSDVGDGSVPFGRIRTVFLTVSAVGKTKDFEERAVLQICTFQKVKSQATSFSSL